MIDWKLFATTFGMLFVAELGDKTQLACMLMTAESKKPLTVFIASALALTAVSLLGVIFADIVCRYISPDIIKKIAGTAFIVIGGLIWLDKF